MNGIANIEVVLSRADAVDVSEGMIAYERYNRTMRRLAECYGYSLPCVAAVFAATSPNNDYIGNLRSTVTLLRAHREGAAFESLTFSCYRACAVRAWSYLNGVDFWEATRGKKIRSFYRNILDPADPYYVTIDGHMIGLWYGQRMKMRDTVQVKWKYEQVAHDFRAVAFRHFILPSQLQAILWFTWKRINRVLFAPQLGLFTQGDQWRLDLRPEDIKPFERKESAA